MNTRVFISTFPYGRFDSTPVDLLLKNKFDISRNEAGRKLKPEETAKLAQGCDAIIAGTEDLTPLIQSSTQLKMISRVGIGLDSVPLHLCKDRGLAVAYTPDAVTMAVAELTIALMIDCLRQVTLCDRQIRQHEWTRPVGARLGMSTIGIMGFGRVGSNVARLLGPFKPRKVLVCDLEDKKADISTLREYYAIEQVSFNTLLEKSDVVSVHVPLTKETRKLFNAGNLVRMKKNGVLVNTARGPIVDEKALFDSLKGGHLSFAALDVYEQEPYRGDLTRCENAILTQHIGSCSFDARLAMETEAAQAVIDFFHGKPLKNPVPEREYLWQQ